MDQLPVQPGRPPIRSHPPHDAQDVPAVIDARMMAPLQRDLQLAQHPRHAYRTARLVVALVRALDVDPAIEREGHRRARAGVQLAGRQLAREHGVQIPVPARQEDARLGVVDEVVGLEELLVARPHFGKRVCFVDGLLENK